MSTVRIETRALASRTVYAVVFRLSDGKVFDWNDNTWQLIGSAVTPGIATTKLVTYGTTQADFAADLNLATVSASMTPLNVSVKFYGQSGGSPAPATDVYLSEIKAFTIVGGDMIAGLSSLPALTVQVTIDTTTTAGTNAHVKVQVFDQVGRLVDLHTLDTGATCAVNVQRDGVHTQFTLSTSDFGAPNNNGWFEADYANPGWTTDVGYTAIATVVTGGVTYTGAGNINIWS